MSFGWIFSAILIAIFVFVAIYGINYFLRLSDCTKVNSFYKDLQTNIDNAYSSPSYSYYMKVSSSKIKKVCFVDVNAPITASLDEYEAFSNYGYDADINMFLYPLEKSCDAGTKNVKHLNITKITKNGNPKCFDVSKNGELLIKKEFYDKGVSIE